jgi:DNA-binding response OmpR family regulator
VNRPAPAPARGPGRPADRPGRVLLVEDEPAWADILSDALSQAGYYVRSVASGAAARASVAADPPEVVVLDLSLPDDDGLTLCVDLKGAADPAILICSATRRRRDTVLGLQLCADDFVTKPCDLDEFVERVGVLLRTHRSRRPPTEDADHLVIDHARRRARLGGATVQLTPAEYRLLAALAEHRGEVVPRSELIRPVDGAPDRGRALDMLVRRLRLKLAALGRDGPRIETERGRGFVLIG